MLPRSFDVSPVRGVGAHVSTSTRPRCVPYRCTAAKLCFGWRSQSLDLDGEHDESYKNFTDMSLLLRNTDSRDFSSGD
jgi:hypothetical protein